MALEEIKTGLSLYSSTVGQLKKIPLKVLSVEDDANAFQILKAVLEHPYAISEEEEEHLTFDLTWAKSLHEARKCLADKRFDVVFLDLFLPDSEGMTSLKTLVKEFPTTPVIVVTALEGNEAGVEAMAHGAQDYLAKATLSPLSIVRSIQLSLGRMLYGENLANSHLIIDRRLLNDLTNLRAMQEIETKTGIISE